MNIKPLFLLVDDDPDDLMLLKDAIRSIKTDIRIEEARDGRSAINFLKAAVHHQSLPSLVVLDINMPLLNGREVIALIKNEEQLKDIPVVAFSTSSYPADIDYCKTYGVQLITKPFGMTLLLDIAKMLVTKYTKV